LQDRSNRNKRSWIHNLETLPAIAILILILVSAADAQVIDHSGGFATHTDLTANGSAVFTSGVARLTDGKFSEAGSIFSNAKVCVQSFSTMFTSQYVPVIGSADGTTFTMQNNNPSALGVGGGGLGYFGIPNSAAVKFDTFNNAGEGTNSTGLFSGGALPFVPAFDVSPVVLSNTNVKKIMLNYDGTNLFETITDTVTNLSFSHTYTPVDIPTLMGGSKTAYVGFTGGTGALTSTQDIQTWTFSNPPVVVSGISVDKPVLWPPNHTMQPVTVNYSASGCGSQVCTLSVSSNEPVNGIGDGNTSPDWVVVDPHDVKLRAERSGKGSGRIYTITIKCTDVAGDVASSTATVTVPHDQSKASKKHG